ncbi:MAG: DUF1858 domain-containing protein [Alphaproteobacteria bacterium]
MAASRVTAETTIARALAADPDLVDRLIAFNPTFRKLKNPILRRTMARLANFADAARVAGVPLEALLAVANGAAPSSAGTAAAPADAGAAGAPGWVAALDRAAATPLDVRPVLASGRDPYATIMGVVAKLQPGAVLILDAPFDPAPLRRVLAGKGFVDHGVPGARPLAIYFRNAGRAAAPAAPAPAPASGATAASRTSTCAASSRPSRCSRSCGCSSSPTATRA